MGAEAAGEVRGDAGVVELAEAGTDEFVVDGVAASE